MPPASNPSIPAPAILLRPPIHAAGGALHTLPKIGAGFSNFPWGSHGRQALQPRMSWQTVLTAKDKAEAEALEQAMVQDGVKRGSRRLPEAEEALKGSAQSAAYPVIDRRALKISGCVSEQQHDKEDNHCRREPGDESHPRKRRRRQDVPLKRAGARWAGWRWVKAPARRKQVRRAAQMADLSGRRYGVIAES